MIMQPAIETLNAELQAARNKMNYANARERELENLIKANADDIRSSSAAIASLEAAIRKLSE